MWRAPPAAERLRCLPFDPLLLRLIHAAPDIRFNYLISIISLGAAGRNGRCLFRLHPDHSRRRKPLLDTNMGYYHHTGCLHYRNYILLYPQYYYWGILIILLPNYILHRCASRDPKGEVGWARTMSSRTNCLNEYLWSGHATSLSMLGRAPRGPRPSTKVAY